MQYVRFGSTGVNVSRLGLGTATLGSIPRDDADRLLAHALDQGVNFIDTAESYPNAEAALGDLLHTDQRRRRVFLASKIFTQRALAGRANRNSRDNLVESLHHSLTTLRTDHLDLYQLHHPDSQTPIEESLTTLDNFVRQGKVRYIGLSNFYAWQAATALGVAKSLALQPPVSLQLSYSPADRPIEIETIPFCRAAGLAVITYHATMTGLFTSATLDRENPLDPAHLRGRGRQIATQRPAELAAFLQTFRDATRRQNLSAQQTAILWQLAKPHITTVLLGGESVEHFADLWPVAERPLPADDVKRLDEAGQCFRYQPFTNQGWADKVV